MIDDNRTIPSAPRSDRVISISEWATLAGFSHATAKREIAAGRGPRLLRLSPRRRGVRLSDHVKWLDERTT
jgi:predicted DNA-binding transcriptional regulator AlpA